jgi:hypothetical protein
MEQAATKAKFIYTMMPWHVYLHVENQDAAPVDDRRLHT